MAVDDKQKFDLDFQALAADWYAALSPTAYTPHSYEDIQNRLTELARDATSLLFEDTYQSANGEQIGVTLAELHYVQGDALGISLKLLSIAWLSRLPELMDDEVHQRMAMLLGDLANGYFRTAAHTILNHQETIREAQLATLKELHADLQNQRNLLRVTAERLQTLHDVESGILAAQSAEAIAEIAVTHLMRIIPCHTASISTIDFERDVFVVLATENTPTEPGTLVPLSLTTKARLQVLAENKSLLVNDIAALEHRTSGLDYIYSRGIRSLLNVPLLALGQLIGVLSLQSTAVGAFNDQHEVIARQIADSVAVALHNRSLLETEKRARQESETLREVAASLSSTLEREELLDYILLQLQKVVPYDGAVILLQSEDKTQIVAHRGFEPEIIDLIHNLDQLPSNMRLLVEEERPVLIPDTELDPDWIRMPGAEHVRCWLGAPLISQGEFIGVLALDKNEPDYYRQSVVDLVLAFANHAAVAIENARLYHEVQRNTETLRDKIAARTRDLESLYEIAAITSQPLELQAIFRAGLLRTLADLRCQSGAIHVLDKTSIVFNLAEHQNLDSNQVEQIRQIDTDSPLMQELFTGQRTIVSSDTSTDPRFHDGMPLSVTKSFAGTPMRARGQVHGILTLYCEHAHHFTKDDIKLFASIADHLGTAIDNAALLKQAETAAVIEERERLARGLHDSATQSLFSLTLFAAAAREKVQSGQLDRALQHLDDIRYTANQTHREMRLLLYELGNPEPAVEGLSETLERRLRAVEGRSGISATFRPLHTGNMDAEVDQVLYKIATEALNNALKYAEGTSIEVEITVDGSHVILSVKDNGIGFDLVEARKGAGRGLTNMKLHAASLGGKLSIMTSIGHGTEIITHIPFGSIS